MACSWLLFTQCMRCMFLCVSWMYNKQICMTSRIPGMSPRPYSHVAVRLPWPRTGWWLAELPASAILTDWSSMCYTPINGSNYQWARLWTLQTEVNTRNKTWGPRGGGGESISRLEASASHRRPLERSEKSLCLIILLTQLVQESSPSLYIKED